MNISFDLYVDIIPQVALTDMKSLKIFVTLKHKVRVLCSRIGLSPPRVGCAVNLCKAAPTSIAVMPLLAHFLALSVLLSLLIGLLRCIPVALLYYQALLS